MENLYNISLEKVVSIENIKPELFMKSPMKNRAIIQWIKAILRVLAMNGGAERAFKCAGGISNAFIYNSQQGTFLSQGFGL